ncbi:alpha-protein kinase 3 isoform X2 [Protopterus annectens]|uniref:alpha-protein kinase 3 isoform X2 n=1 Tax=Protopterus annectens TaxID=7888 RepID=UPI001CF96D45|nr:alpha-protein kinase 3 isoform X2 [Protopterus annectens]
MGSRRPLRRAYSGNEQYLLGGPGMYNNQNGDDLESFINNRPDSSRNYLLDVRPENRTTFCNIMTQLTEETQPCFEVTLKSRAVSEDNDAKFTCVVSGYPEPELTWYKDDLEMDRYCGLPKYQIFRNGKKHTLQLYRCTEEDAAIYQASAKNSKGIVSCSGVLEVGTMTEFKIHQRWFSTLKAKAEAKRREIEGQQRDKEKVVPKHKLQTVSPERVHRKRRLSGETNTESVGTLDGKEDIVKIRIQDTESRLYDGILNERECPGALVHEIHKEALAQPKESVSSNENFPQNNMEENSNGLFTYVCETVEMVARRPQKKEPLTRRKRLSKIEQEEERHVDKSELKTGSSVGTNNSGNSDSWSTSMSLSQYLAESVKQQLNNSRLKSEDLMETEDVLPHTLCLSPDAAGLTPLKNTSELSLHNDVTALPERESEHTAFKVPESSSLQCHTADSDEGIHFSLKDIYWENSTSSEKDTSPQCLDDLIHKAVPQPQQVPCTKDHPPEVSGPLLSTAPEENGYRVLPKDEPAENTPVDYDTPLKPYHDKEKVERALDDEKQLTNHNYTLKEKYIEQIPLVTNVLNPEENQAPVEHNPQIMYSPYKENKEICMEDKSTQTFFHYKYEDELAALHIPPLLMHFICEAENKKTVESKPVLPASHDTNEKEQDIEYRPPLANLYKEELQVSMERKPLSDICQAAGEKEMFMEQRPIITPYQEKQEEETVIEYNPSESLPTDIPKKIPALESIILIPHQRKTETPVECLSSLTHKDQLEEDISMQYEQTLEKLGSKSVLSQEKCFENLLYGSEPPSANSPLASELNKQDDIGGLDFGLHVPNKCSPESDILSLSSLIKDEAKILQLDSCTEQLASEVLCEDIKMEESASVSNGLSQVEDVGGTICEDTLPKEVAQIAYKKFVGISECKTEESPHPLVTGKEVDLQETVPSQLSELIPCITLSEPMETGLENAKSVISDDLFMNQEDKPYDENKYVKTEEAAFNLHDVIREVGPEVEEESEQKEKDVVKQNMCAFEIKSQDTTVESMAKVIPDMIVPENKEEIFDATELDQKICVNSDESTKDLPKEDELAVLCSSVDSTPSKVTVGDSKQQISEQVEEAKPKSEGLILFSASTTQVPQELQEHKNESPIKEDSPTTYKVVCEEPFEQDQPLVLLLRSANKELEIIQSVDNAAVVDDERKAESSQAEIKTLSTSEDVKVEIVTGECHEVLHTPAVVDIAEEIQEKYNLLESVGTAVKTSGNDPVEPPTPGDTHEKLLTLNEEAPIPTGKQHKNVVSSLKDTLYRFLNITPTEKKKVKKDAEDKSKTDSKVGKKEAEQTKVKDLMTSVETARLGVLPSIETSRLSPPPSRKAVASVIAKDTEGRELPAVPSIVVGDTALMDSATLLQQNEMVASIVTAVDLHMKDGNSNLNPVEILPLIPSATPQELALGARRKIFLPKAKQLEDSDTPVDSTQQQKKEEVTRRASEDSTPAGISISPGQSRKAFLQTPGSPKLLTSEKRSPTAARKMSTLEVPKLYDEPQGEKEVSEVKKPEPKEFIADEKNDIKTELKQSLDPFRAPQVIRKIRAEQFSDASGHLKLWCQFFNVLSDSMIIWHKDGHQIAEMTKSAGEEGRVAVAVVEASAKDCGIYQCTIENEYGKASTDFLMNSEVLSGLVLREDVEVGEEIEMTPMHFTKGLSDSGYWGENYFGRITIEEANIGKGHRQKGWRVKVIYGLDPVFESGTTCIIKVRNPVPYEVTSENSPTLTERNHEITMQQCKIQNTAREFYKIFAAEARVIQNFGQVIEIIPLYIIYRPANNIPYATIEEELKGKFVKYSRIDRSGNWVIRSTSEIEQKCCTFLHWLYQWTNGNLLLTNLEGVNWRATCVEIAVKVKGYHGFKENCNPSLFEQFLSLHHCNHYCELLQLRSLKIIDTLQQPAKPKGAKSPSLGRKPVTPQSSPQTQKKGSVSPQAPRKGGVSPKAARKSTESDENRQAVKHSTVEIPKPVKLR